jgi:hypothetical protein
MKNEVSCKLLVQYIMRAFQGPLLSHTGYLVLSDGQGWGSFLMEGGNIDL